MSSLTPREEITATHRWIIGLVLTIIIQSGVVFFWAASTQAQVFQNKEDIKEIQEQVNGINKDIREILIGIEQVKARLGIVETQ